MILSRNRTRVRLTLRGPGANPTSLMCDIGVWTVFTRRALPPVRVLLILSVLASPAAVCAAGHLTLKLWPDRAPGETGDIGPEREVPPKEGEKEIIRLTDVSVPAITLYRAPETKANGTAVLIAPGGG